MKNSTAFSIQDFELTPWQLDAVDSWASGKPRPYNGTLEVFTGGGKTLISLACAARAAQLEPDLSLAIVVPTEALARQWRQSILQYTSLTASDIGLLGAGGSATFADHRAVVSVLNTASKRLPELARTAQPLMLIVDECHRAGAPSFSRVLDTPAQFRLGLSATPEREELDESGEPIRFDEQLVGRRLGQVVYRFSLKDAREHGWLPEYRINHHGLSLSPEERLAYDRVSRRVDELSDELRDLGVDRGRVQHLQKRGDAVGAAARAYVAVTAQRKDLLYRSDERTRVATKLVADCLRLGPRRVLLFHERVDQAVVLYEALAEALPDNRVVLEHSRLANAERIGALGAFRSGEAQVLVSVKSLIEGIDVPDADVGISVASSSSVRQRIQSLGRVLRRNFDENAPQKHADMHLLYMADTVDESIYAKEDWADLTGEGTNFYWRWSLDPDLPPEQEPGPPASPRPTEEQEWERLGGAPPAKPERWLGVISGQEYSVDTLGTVTNMTGTVMANSQGVPSMVEAVRGRPGGKFHVTPMHSLVIVFGDLEGSSVPFVAGMLGEPFVGLEDEPTESEVDADISSLRAGDVFPGVATKEGGTYHLRQKRGGVIERKADGATEFALTDDSPDEVLAANARKVLEAWRSVFDRGITFYVNNQGHAWYTEGGSRKFLADVPGGFAWPEP